MVYFKFLVSTPNSKNWEWGNLPMILRDIPRKEIPEETLPCWSLGALLEVMPDSIKNRELLIYKTPYQNTMMWEVGYGYNEINNRISKSLLNSVFNTVVWLLENGYLKKE